MNNKVLIIGDYHPEGVDCCYWFDELPNISDYDIVILDTTRILNFWNASGRLKHLAGNEFETSYYTETDRRIMSNIDFVRNKLIEILIFDVTIYALYEQNFIIKSKPDSRGHIGLYVRTNDWCPIFINNIVIEKGRTILVKDESYEEYFKDFKNWEYYINPDDIQFDPLQNFYSGKWLLVHEIKSIATNRVDKPIALQFCPILHRKEDTDLGKYEYVYDRRGALLVLLPIANRYDTSPHIEILLRRHMQYEETPPPSWINDIEIPGEVPLKRQINTANEEFKKAEAEVKKLEASLQEIEKYKRLLYDTGLSLQDISKQALEELGVKTKPSISTDEFIIEVGTKEALIEVKGNTKSVKKEDIAQLIVDLGQHLKDTGEEIKGILIGNAWRLSPLEDRESKPVFTKETIQAANNHNIGLISTVELFKAYCSVLEKPGYRSEVLKKIIKGKGIIQFL